MKVDVIATAVDEVDEGKWGKVYGRLKVIGGIVALFEARTDRDLITQATRCYKCYIDER